MAKTKNARCKRCGNVLCGSEERGAVCNDCLALARCDIASMTRLIATDQSARSMSDLDIERRELASDLDGLAMILEAAPDIAGRRVVLLLEGESARFAAALRLAATILD